MKPSDLKIGTKIGFLILPILVAIVIILLPGQCDAAPSPKIAPVSTKKPAIAESTAQPADALKPYTDVITAKAVTQKGTITVHKVDDNYYFEIPKSQLDKPYMWVTEIAQIGAGTGYAGAAVGNTVVQWTRRDKHIDLRSISYDIRSKDGLPIQEAVADSSLNPIIATFDILTEGPDHAAVIDVSHFLVSDTPELSPKSGLGGGSPDATRSYIDKVKVFPTNLEAHVFWTVPTGNVHGQSLTARVNYSMVELPASPMMGRYYDSRVGYFTEDFQDYGSTQHRVVDRRYITRFRLEKLHPDQQVSDPKVPIVFYLSREIPDIWRPYIKAGIEAWQGPLQTAGFKNAILAKDAPTTAQDPDWDPEDARYNVVRWAPTPNENAMGPHVDDPRSGEIIESHVIIWHNVLKLLEDWYFVQASPNNVEAQKLPIPDKLMGQLLQMVVTHEIGHTLGLAHNFKASSAYTVQQLRDPAFTAKWGDEASIMDYGRFNYVAQPGDNASLIPKLGPYDYFAIRWGYTPVPYATSPKQEKAYLNRVADEQRLNPVLRFGNDHSEDPTDQREDLSDDPVEATRLGLMNIDRVAGYIIPATTHPGGDFDQLKELFGQLNLQRERELSNVVQLVGGVVNTDWHAGYGGPDFTPVPAFRQREAVQFLIKSALTTPSAVYNPDLLYRVQSFGLEDTVALDQGIVLSDLLSDDRLDRMLDSAFMQTAPAYSVRNLFTDLENGVWNELMTPRPKINWYRRVAQRELILQLRDKLRTAGSVSVSESAAAAQATLADLTNRIDRALPRVKDQDTRDHLLNCLASLKTAIPGKTVSNIAPDTSVDRSLLDKTESLINNNATDW